MCDWLSRHGHEVTLFAPPPAGLPRETVAKLNGELAKALNATEMKERFAKQGTEVRTGTPEALGAWMRAEQARWAKVVKESGTRFD